MKHIFFRNRIYRQITINQWVSALGDTLFYLAFINYVSSYSFAPTAIFLISLSEVAPSFFRFFVASFADFQTNRMTKALVISFSRILLYSLVTWVLISWEFTLFSVAIICLANFVSDVMSAFGGAMTGPMYMKAIEDDMAEAMGFSQATGSLVSVIGNLSGALLLTVMSIQQLSALNVLTFAFAFVGSFHIRRQFEQFEQDLVIQREFNLKNYGLHLVTAIKGLLKMETVKNLLLTSSMDNVVIDSTVSILVLILIAHPLKGLSTGQTLSIYTTLFMAVMILGNLMTSKWFTKTSLKTFILVSQFFAYVILLGYLTNNVLLVGIGGIGCAFINGLMSPQVQQKIWTSLPADSMGAMSAAVGILLSVIPSLLTMLAVWLATSLSLPSATLFLAVLLLASTVLTLKTKTY